MIEGSGSVPLTNRSGSGSRRPKNIRIRNYAKNWNRFNINSTPRNLSTEEYHTELDSKIYPFEQKLVTRLKRKSKNILRTIHRLGMHKSTLIKILLYMKFRKRLKNIFNILYREEITLASFANWGAELDWENTHDTSKD
jgi:hypothetical protein